MLPRLCGSLCCLASLRRGLSQTAAGHREFVDRLWRDFFSDPSQWWDHRLEKVNPRHPDFKHKKTQDALWLDGKSRPSWVEAELAALAPGILQADIFSWNRRLSKYAKARQYETVIELSHKMQQEGISPDRFTFIPILTACSNLEALEEGRCIHTQIAKSGYGHDLFISNSLVDMYAKCGSIDDAWRVFKRMPIHNVVSWNAMLLGYVKCGQGQKALELFPQMQLEGLEPDRVTFLAVLNACANVGALEEGRQFHGLIIQRGLGSDVVVGSCLVDMFAKCGSIEEACRVFNSIPKHDLVSWNAMILGYVKCGKGQTALELYRRMQWEGVKPSPTTFVAVINACACAAAIEEGRRVHEQITESGCESNVFVGNSLIDMYAKCGSIDDAQKVLNKMPIRNVVSWTALLGGYAMHGLSKEALGHFHQMCQEGVDLNEITFISLLAACNHAGLVDEGLVYFEAMSVVHNIPATVQHYACMIDLLGRAGRLHEAEDLLKNIPCESDVTVWKSLLGACTVHHNLEMGERIAEKVLELDPGKVSNYVLLSNIHAAAGKWVCNPKRK